MKFLRLFFVCLVGGLFLVSCQDFLDLLPEDQANGKTFFKNANSAASAVAAAYKPWINSADLYKRDMVIMFDNMTDDGYWRPSRAASIQQARWDITPTTGTMNTYWHHVYQSINFANYAIENIPKSSSEDFTEEEQKPFIAEARFLRAFDYLFLVTYYGRVPMITKTLNKVDEYSQPLGNIDDIYKQIINDFEFAKASLPEQQSRGGAPTKATAAAYLAKTYLYMKDFPKAETAARSAIDIAHSSGYQLIDDYMSIWDINNEENPELLFYWSFARNDPDLGQVMTVQRICRDAAPPFKNIYGAGDGWGYALPQRSLYDAFESDDPRRGYTIFAPGDFFGIYNGSPFTYTSETLKENNNGGLDTIRVTKSYVAGDSVFYDYRWSPSGMNVRKMISDLTGLTNVRYAGQDVPMLRMSGLYLFLAEALAEQGDPEALEWVDKVRARPSVNLPPRSLNDGRLGDDNLVDIVRHERRVELAMEGVRLGDLMRWGKLKGVFGDGTKVKRHFYSDFIQENPLKRFDAPELGKYGDNKIYFPIPQDELDQNKNIDFQNPGY